MDQQKVKVTPEVAAALDKQRSCEWTKEFNLISHCKSFTGNGVLMYDPYLPEYAVLATLSPLDFAKCLIIGYEVIEEEVAI